MHCKPNHADIFQMFEKLNRVYQDAEYVAYEIK